MHATNARDKFFKMAKSPEVFISYVREEDALVQFSKKVQGSLEEAGLVVWRDESTNHSYEERAETLSNCHYLVCIVTKSYITSVWCKNELLKVYMAMGAEEDTLIVPLVFESVDWDVDFNDVDVEGRFQAESVRFLFSSPFWTLCRRGKDDYNTAMQRVIAQVKKKASVQYAEEKGDIFSLHPTVMQLTKMGVIAKISKVWMDVGLLLGCEHSLLDYIQSNHSNSQNRCIQMFGEWLHHKEQTGGKPRTWRTVLEAVKESSTQGHGQKKEIEKMLIERNEGRYTA